MLKSLFRPNDVVRSCAAAIAVAAMAGLATAQAPAQAQDEVVFVDPGVSRTEVFERFAGDAEFVRLDAERAPLEQIADYMDGQSGVRSVHLISHGAPGALQFSGGRVDRAALDSGIVYLSRIRAALADGADIRLYACRVAEDEEGRAFAGALADALDADLAASSDITGAAGMGGDWDLEWRSGDLEDSAIHRRFAVSGYMATLADLGSDVTVTFQGAGFNAGGGFISNPYTDGSGFSFFSNGVPSGPATGLGGHATYGEGGSEAIYPTNSATELEITYSGDNFAFNSFYIDTSGLTLNFQVRGYDSGSNLVATQTFNSVGPAAGTLTLTEAGFSEVASIVIEGTSGQGVQGIAFDSFSFSAPSSPDTTAPRVTSIARETPASATTNADSLVFRVTFDENVTGVDVTDFAVSGSSAAATNVTANSATEYDVTVSGGDLASFEGSVGLGFAGGQNIADTPAGNALVNTTPIGANESYTLDNTAPVLNAFARNTPAAQNTNTDSLVFDITFDGTVQNVTADDFTITGTTATGVIGGSGAAYTLTVSGGDLAGLTGTVGIDLAGGQNITDAAGNAVAAGEPATDQTYILDNTAPVLTAFARNTPVAQSTNADSLVFDITFDGTVQNVTADDFTITGTTATGVIGGSGASYTLTVSGGDLAGLTGTVGLNLAGGQNITDASGNAVAAGEPATDETYSVDNAAPRVSSIARQNPGAATTNADSLVFRVTFDEGVSNVGIADFTASGTTATATDVTANSATEYDVTISGGDLVGFEGAVGLGFAGGQDIADLAGNALVNTTPTGANESYTLDNTAPTLTAFARNTPAAENTNADTLIFDITFDSTVQNVTADDFTITGTTATGVIGGTGAAYTLTISGGDLAGLTGTVGLDLAGGQNITDAAGNAVPAGEPATDQTYSVENTEPRIASIIRQTPAAATTNADSLVFRVTFDRPVQNVDTTDFAATASTATASNVAANSTSQYDVTLSGGNLTSFDGSVGLGFAGGQDIQDLLTNPLTNTAPTGANESYAVDNTAPAGFSVSFGQGPVTGAIENAISFTFTGGEASADYNYTISSNNGGANVTGSGTLAGATDTISGIDVSGLNDGTLILSVTLTDPAGNVSGAQTDTATKDTNLPGFSKAFAPASVQTGDVSTLTFTIDNSALAVGVTALDFTDNLPAGMEVAATPNASTTCTGGTLTAVAGAGVVSYTGGVIGAGATCTVDVDVSATAAGSLLNTTGNLTSSQGNSGTASATLTVTQPGLSVDDPSIAEGDSGTANLVFTVTLAPASAQTVTVDYATSDGTATAGADYTATSGTLTFTAGQTTRTVTVTVLNETLVEPDETVNLTLSNPSNATISDATGTGTIQTDDTDATAPVLVSIERQTPASAATNADSLTWTVTFSEDVTSVDAADFSVAGSSAGVTGLTGAGATYSVTVSGGDLAGLTGPVELALAAGVSIDDLAGNALTDRNPSGADETYALDNTLPTVAAIERDTPPGASTNADTLTWAVTFSEDVTGVDAADFAVNGSTATVTGVTGSGGRYSVTVSGGDLAGLSGTVGLDLDAAATIEDAVGNALTDLDPTGADETYTLENDHPTVSAIERQSPSVETTNADALTWAVTFSEDVTGVDAADFAVAGSTATVTGVTGSGGRYSVTVSGGDLAGLSGTVGLDLDAAATIEDAVGNALTDLDPTGADETYLLDGDVPGVVLDAGTTGPVAAPFTLTVTFSEPVSGFALSGLDVTNAAAGNFQTVSASVYTIDITPPDSGSLSLSVPAGAATDSAGNENTASAVLTLEADGVGPEVVSIEALNALVTNTDTPAWRVTFSEAVAGADASDFTLAGAGNVALTAASDDDTVFVVTASGGTLEGLDGDILFGFAADQDIADRAGNALADTAPTGTDQSSVTLDNTAPQITLTASADPVTGPFMVTVEFSEPVTGFALDDLVIDNATADNLTPETALEYTVEITPETFGAITVAVAAGAAIDAAGNGSLAASLSVEAVTPQVDVEIDIDVDDNDPVGIAGTATVSNPGELPVDFRAEANVAWLSVTPETGTIEGLSEIVFTVSVTEEARNLAPGDYTGQVTIYRMLAASSSASRSRLSAPGEAVLVEIPVSLSLQSTMGTLQLVSTTPGGPSGDASFAFASDLPAIDGQVLATSGGRAQTTVMELTSGTFDIQQSVPQGWRIDAISCSGDADQGSQIDTVTGRVRVDLDVSEAIVCTFENVRDEDAVRLATQRAIRNFMLRRADRIIEAAPDLSRRLGARDMVRPGAFAANVDGGRYNLSMSASLSGMRNSAKADEPDAPGVRSWEREPDDRLDVWMSAEMSGVSDDRAGERAESDFGVFQIGADWALSDDMLVGAMLQYDWMDEEAREVFVEAGAVAGAVVSGEGWMAGPYMVWRFADGITFDGMALYGTSSNTVNPLGLYEDAFDTDRWMLRANLTGEYSDGGPWTLRPQATLTHFEESQGAYIDTLGIAIPGQSITLGRFAAGPEVIWRHSRVNGGHFELSTRMRAVWDYHPAELLGDAGQLTGGESDLRADGRFGAGAVFANGAMLGLEISVAGIGDGDFEANSARINFRFPLSLGR